MYQYHQTDSNGLLLGFSQVLYLLSYGGVHESPPKAPLTGDISPLLSQCRQTDSNDRLLGFNQALSLLSYGGKLWMQLQTNRTHEHQIHLMFISNKRHRASLMSGMTLLRSTI